MKLPLLSGRQVLAALERLGFHQIHRKGSHVKMEHPDGRRIVFPFHDEIDRYTLKGALRDNQQMDPTRQVRPTNSDRLPPRLAAGSFVLGWPGPVSCLRG